MKRKTQTLFRKLGLLIMVIFVSAGICAQHDVSGTVTDTDGISVPGVAIVLKGTSSGTITDLDGRYTLSAPADGVLQFSFVGKITIEEPINGRSSIDVTLLDDAISLKEVVVVGYGTMKKESVVGAITQAKGEDLLQAGGVTNVEQALQGRLPGVTTISSRGVPGESDPLIYIRGQSSWNSSGRPLILVDGVERSMSDIDMNEIDRISVLKDASATAVFGVKGANGVILITTKRGQIGKAQLDISGNATMKMYSKLPEKLESYDAIMVANESIMREIMYRPDAWRDYVPMAIADKYRNPQTQEESYIYPNVDWTETILKDYAMDYRINLSVRGGSDFTKYFGGLSFQTVSDLFKGNKYPNGKGYESGFSYKRFNYRSNLDFNITKTTEFSVNLSGFLGMQMKPSEKMMAITNSLYALAPSLYTPIYPDGYYGALLGGDWFFKNPLVSLTNIGYENYNRFQVNSDFILKQKLDFITKGLSFKAMLSYDNNMTSLQRLIDPKVNQIDNVLYRAYDINGNEFILSPVGTNNFDYVVQPWTIGPDQVQQYSRSRRLNYEFSLNYNRVFAEKHNTTALFLMKREEYAIGSMFPRYREDWVGRVTYNYNLKYFIDANGAYNGSEQFGPGYRFDLFPSVALGWMISNESFMQRIEWIDKLKIRGSYGKVGDDGIGGNRWAYLSQWGSGGNAFLVPSSFPSRSPYTWYYETVVGNPDLKWETATKSNIGLELSVLRNKLSVDFDYFTEDRDDILILGKDLAIPDFYGAEPPSVNAGQVEVSGYELVLGFNHRFNNGINVWANYSLTDAKDKIIYKAEASLKPDYQKQAGYPIGQPRLPIEGDLLQSWDDIYMATPKMTGQNSRRPGYYDLVDFNIDGEYNGTYDNVPYGYPVRPQRTWSFSAGAGYKGVQVMIHFYGTQNALRYYNSLDFTKQTHLFYEHNMGYWSVDNPSSTLTMKPWSLSESADDPYSNWFDASLVRLKTIELSYDLHQEVCNRIGLGGLRVFINGNNLFLWTKLPDDREYNEPDSETLINSQSRGDYPTMKRFNFGFNLNF